MSEKIVQLNEEVIKGQLKELVRGSVEETLKVSPAAISELIVIGVDETTAYVITAYYLSTDKFEANLRTRKER